MPAEAELHRKLTASAILPRPVDHQGGPHGKPKEEGTLENLFGGVALERPQMLIDDQGKQHERTGRQPFQCYRACLHCSCFDQKEQVCCREPWIAVL